MKKHLLKIPFFGILILILLAGCRTEDSYSNNAKAEKMIESAKNYYQTSSAASSINKVADKIDWDHPIYSTGANGDVVEFPFTTKSNMIVGSSIASFPFYNRILMRFQGDQWEIYHVIIKTNQPDFNNYNNEFNYYKLNEKSFNGIVSMYNINSQESKMDNYTKVIDERGKINVKQAPVDIVCTYFGAWDGDVFTPYYLVGCINMGGPMGDNSGGYGHGGGGSGSGGSQATNNIDIEALQNFKCAYAVAQQLPNLNNDLAKLLQDTFGTSDKINVTFKGKDKMGTLDGERDPAVRDFDKGTIGFTIYINEDVLNYATKEYILVTMYHEVIHAYLGYEAATNPEYSAKFPKVNPYQIIDANGKIITNYTLDADHKNYGPFVSSMVNAIKSFNPNIPTEVAEAMAKMGVIDEKALTNDEIVKSNNERDTRNQNNVGTKCP